MKKLMIAVAAVSMAVAANAGCYTWGFSSGADIIPGGGDEDYLDGGTAMLFLGTIGQTLNADGTYSLNFTGATLVGNTDESFAISGQDGELFTFGQNKFSKDYKSDFVTTDASQAYSLILFENSGVTDYENYEGAYHITTGNSILTQDAETSTDYAKFVDSAPVGGGDWRTASAVPEPTSGLLLLLGVAGLALRRRRA